jgi:malonyl-CoA O-methyltransferase
MILEKNRIKNNFNKSSLTYDKVSSVQKSCGEKLITMINKHFNEFYPQSSLDIGTGTGYMAKLINERYPLSDITLNDISSSMLQVATKNLKLKKILRTILGDAENQIFPYHDLIVSNFTLQWTNNLNNMIENLYKNSQILAFTCLLDETFSEWGQMFQKLSIVSPLYNYPSKNTLHDYLLSLQPKKYFYDTQKFVLEFENAYSFIKYLKNLGAIQGSSKINLKNLKRFLTTYTEKFSVTYNVFFAIISK